MSDILKIGKYEFNSRFILGSGKFSLSLLEAVINEGEAELITLALRRANNDGQENILDFIPKNLTLLPNTSGARTAQEALRIARLGRELGCGDMVKLEIICDSKYLLPDNYKTIEATKLLVEDGFTVLPYCYPDFYVAKELESAGAAAIMPLGSFIGSNRGLQTKDFIQILVDEINLPIIVDAGIGTPAQACEAMQMGVDAVMLNTAVASAKDMVLMSRAFKHAIKAGRDAYLGGLGRVLEKAEASSPLDGTLTSFLEN